MPFYFVKRPFDEAERCAFPLPKGRKSPKLRKLDKPYALGYPRPMVTVLRAAGLRVVIFANDHGPAHVHVFGDGEAKIALSGPDGVPALVWADAMDRGEVRRVMRLVTEQQVTLLARWRELHERSD